jgi:retinol dehydrogenase 12
MAKEVLERFQRLDVLVNNAGVYMSKRTITKDKLEETYAVNYFAPFLLTHLLLARLKQSKDGRIVNVSSIGHQLAKHFEPHQLVETNKFSGIGNYAASKLALILFTCHLSKVLQLTTVKVNSLHPGGVATRIARRNRFLHLVMTWLGASAEKGASSVIFLAQSERASGFSGKYFEKEDRSPISSSTLSSKDGLAEELYNWTLGYFGIQAS